MHLYTDYLKYPATITKEADGSGYSVFIRGLDKAHTCGKTLAEAVDMAKDLILAIATFTCGTALFPKGEQAQKGEIEIVLSADTALKILLRNAMFENNISTADLARLLKERDSKVRNTLNFRRATKLETLRQYFEAVGIKLKIGY